MQVLHCLPNQKIVPINLSVSLGRGGEACIYTVPSDAQTVAKVYHKPNAEKASKLEVMVLHPPSNPTASLGHISIAWPSELIRPQTVVIKLLVLRCRAFGECVR